MDGKDAIIVEDPSDIARQNERVRELETELARWKSMFDASRMLIGHEIVRPLTAIEGYLDLLEAELDSGSGNSGREYLKKIRNATRRLQDISDSFVQMLMIDKENSGNIGREKVRIGELVQDVISRFDNKALKVRLKISPDIPPLSVCKRYLEVVLENIISNAMEHADRASPLEIEAFIQEERRGDSSGKLLIVEIRDRGTGIPQDKVGEIFSPFYKLDDKGMGLGLTLVKNLLYVMGGNISINSREGEGTKVTIALPYL